MVVVGGGGGGRCGGGGYSGFQVTGKIEGFWGVNFSISGFFVGNFWQVFFW